ncbi:MAG: murein biosynthesis integral membrane protein MurJ [Oscillatoriales cyanobacterium SM2_1_8]|nr:murein biosynthesis integral membrane protein MurJ [Oscillatoriales cyanobacterium SM2_1_8]
MSTARSVLGVARIVALATLLSKVFGLGREVVVAAAFGASAITDAFSYAYVVPGFLLILLGGINGPFHSAVVSVVSKRGQGDTGEAIETLTTMVGAILLVGTVGLLVFAEPIVAFATPGFAQSADGEAIRAIAVGQFRIMAPLALLAGAIGIGFGTLNAADMYWLPSVSPLFSSVAVMGAVGVAVWYSGGVVTDVGLGGQALAWGVLLGALAQWLVQLAGPGGRGMGRFRLRWDTRHPAVQEMLRVMVPATLSSGLLHVNVYTDLWFASFLTGNVAAALGFAQPLVQTPLGLLSNVILVPYMPLFSRLAGDGDWSGFAERLRQGLLVTAIAMLPVGALTVALAEPVVRAIYERAAFDREASRLVASLLAAYGVGMFFYLARDVVVRAYYALGDGETPFRISIAGIGLNALFNYLAVSRFGAPGLALATAGVNAISLGLLLFLLQRRLGPFPWRTWGQPFVLLLGFALLAGGVGYGMAQAGTQIWGDRLWVARVATLGAGGISGLVTFGLLTLTLRLPELTSLLQRLRRTPPP